MTSGEDSSSSQQSSWDGSDRHAGDHFTLVVFPDGKLILTTPAELEPEGFQRVHNLMKEWINSDYNFPLVIGKCTVHLSMVGAHDASVIPVGMIS